jgi:mRNA interferase ChpB
MTANGLTLPLSAGKFCEARRHLHGVAQPHPTEFNAATKLPVVLPITNGGDFARRIGFAVEITGIKTTGLVRCDQPRVLDIAERGGRKVDTLPDALLDQVLAKVVTLFEI